MTHFVSSAIGQCAACRRECESERAGERESGKAASIICRIGQWAHFKVSLLLSSSASVVQRLQIRRRHQFKMCRRADQWEWSKRHQVEFIVHSSHICLAGADTFLFGATFARKLCQRLSLAMLIDGANIASPYTLSLRQILTGSSSVFKFAMAIATEKKSLSANISERFHCIYCLITFYKSNG